MLAEGGKLLLEPIDFELEYLLALVLLVLCSLDELSETYNHYLVVGRAHMKFMVLQVQLVCLAYLLISL